jgi:hypothetical protein
MNRCARSGPGPGDELREGGAEEHDGDVTAGVAALSLRALVIARRPPDEAAKPLIDYVRRVIPSIGGEIAAR